MNDSEQTEGEYLTALGFFEPFPFQLLITFAATNAGWNMVVLQRCRLQYSLFRPILPSLHRPLGALGSNPPQAVEPFGCPPTEKSPIGALFSACLFSLILISSRSRCLCRGQTGQRRERSRKACWSWCCWDSSCRWSSRSRGRSPRARCQSSTW